MMLKRKAMRPESEGHPGRARLAAAVFAGAIALTNCYSQVHAEPQAPIEVVRYLKEAPAGLAELNNEPQSGTPLHGLLGDCRGKKSCTIPLHEGDLVLDIGFDPVEGGNLEVTVNKIEENGILFKGRIDFNMTDVRNHYQLIRFGTEAKLLKTNLSVRVERTDNGSYTLSVN